jgi:hypothetical protein
LDLGAICSLFFLRFRFLLQYSTHGLKITVKRRPGRKGKAKSSPCPGL